MTTDAPRFKLTCTEYQIIAEQAPDINEDDRRMAVVHLTDCFECRERRTAYKSLKAKQECKS